MKSPKRQDKARVMNFHCQEIFPHKKVCTGDKLFFKTYYLRSINACPIFSSDKFLIFNSKQKRYQVKNSRAERDTERFTLDFWGFRRKPRREFTMM